MYDEPDTNLTTLELEAPGVNKDGVEIALFERVLTISCNATSTARTTAPLGRFYHAQERQTGRLSRTVTLPAGTKVVSLPLPSLRPALQG